MTDIEKQFGIRPAWWTVILLGVITGLVFLTAALFSGTLRSYIPVTLTSDRSGLVMEPGGKVKLRGVEVGTVGTVSGGSAPVTMQLRINPEDIDAIPANVTAQIKDTTIFGSKFVDLEIPDVPSAKPLTAGAILHSRTVTSEVNTVFENMTVVLKSVDPAKLNAVLRSLADAVRDKGERMGEAITSANDVLLAVDPRMDTVQQDFRSLTGLSNAYSAGAQDILATLSAASTTSQTVTNHAASLDAFLLGAIGFARSGATLLASSEQPLVQAVNILEPTTNLLLKYNPEYTCLFVGAKWFLDHGGYDAIGGNGYAAILDSGLLLGDNIYKYPQNLPKVAAKGGPGGKPGCGSLPRVDQNYPVRQLVTDTGWGTGPDDIRTRPGIAHPWYVDFFPVTRAVPEPPSIRGNR